MGGRSGGRAVSNESVLEVISLLAELGEVIRYAEVCDCIEYPRANISTVSEGGNKQPVV